MNWTWIPQLFSDLLGRIVPGAAVIIVSYLVALGPTRGASNLTDATLYEKLFALGPALIFLLGSYLVGFIVGQLWITLVGERAMIDEAEKKRDLECREACLAEHDTLQAALGMAPLALKPTDLPRTFVMHDHLRLVAGVEAQRLLKLRSERRLCHVIVLGFLALGLVNLGYIISQPSADRLVLELLLVLSVVSCWQRALRLEKQFVNGTCIAWLSHASAKRLLSQADTETEDTTKAAPRGVKPPNTGPQADSSAVA